MLIKRLEMLIKSEFEHLDGFLSRWISQPLESISSRWFGFKKLIHSPKLTVVSLIFNVKILYGLRLRLLFAVLQKCQIDFLATQLPEMSWIYHVSLFNGPNVNFSMHSKCMKSELLKSELLKSELVWNLNLSEIQTFVSLNFRHPYVSENQTLGLDFRHFTKVSEIQTWKLGLQTPFGKKCLNTELWVRISDNVWNPNCKPNSYWVSEIHTS